MYASVIELQYIIVLRKFSFRLFRASINHVIAISTSLETFEILNLMLVTVLFLLCRLISNSVSSRLLNLNTRRVADGQIDLSSPKYENHLLNAVLCVPLYLRP